MRKQIFFVLLAGVAILIGACEEESQYREGWTQELLNTEIEKCHTDYRSDLDDPRKVTPICKCFLDKVVVNYSYQSYVYPSDQEYFDQNVIFNKCSADEGDSLRLLVSMHEGVLRQITAEEPRRSRSERVKARLEQIRREKAEAARLAAQEAERAREAAREAEADRADAADAAKAVEEAAPVLNAPAATPAAVENHAPAPVTPEGGRPTEMGVTPMAPFRPVVGNSENLPKTPDALQLKEIKGKAKVSITGLDYIEPRFMGMEGESYFKETGAKRELEIENLECYQMQDNGKKTVAIKMTVSDKEDLMVVIHDYAEGKRHYAMTGPKLLEVAGDPLSFMYEVNRNSEDKLTLFPNGTPAPSQTEITNLEVREGVISGKVSVKHAGGYLTKQEKSPKDYPYADIEGTFSCPLKIY